MKQKLKYFDRTKALHLKKVNFLVWDSVVSILMQAYDPFFTQLNKFTVAFTLTYGAPTIHLPRFLPTHPPTYIHTYIHT